MWHAGCRCQAQVSVLVRASHRGLSLVDVAELGSAQILRLQVQEGLRCHAGGLGEGLRDTVAIQAGCTLGVLVDLELAHGAGQVWGAGLCLWLASRP